ncbi:MAG: hypothetical protein F6J86_25950 [Symploca sp. SIO1B1]|nr:hypothetical protein [Symploca sp. SIO1B1]
MDKLSDQVRQEWREAAFEWLAKGDNDSYFCGVPAAFRDRAKTEGKRNKAYLQWLLEFSVSPQFAATQVSKFPAMKTITEKLTELHHYCAGQMTPILSELIDVYPQFGERYDPRRPLPLVFKVVRYNHSPGRFATDPHFDKSGLSAILQADDPRVMWRVGKGNPCRLSQAIAPFDYPEDPTAPSPSIIFPGLCLEEAGLEVSPTPHFVLPVEERNYRHSVIAFLLVPHLTNPDNMNTTAPVIQDALYEVA